MNYAAVPSGLMEGEFLLFLEEDDAGVRKTVRQRHSGGQADYSSADDGEIVGHGWVAEIACFRGCEKTSTPLRSRPRINSLDVRNRCGRLRLMIAAANRAPN